MGSTIRVHGADVRTVAQMAATIYAEKVVFLPAAAARDASVDDAIILFHKVKEAMKDR